MYNFKGLTVVPSSSDFVNIVLSKTQRKTPTVIHKNYEISRIRKFYTRKVKFTQKSIHDRLTELLENFPRMDDIHPFYGDLMNVLYDKDHYKVALGQISATRHIVDSIGRDYVRLLKYGDSMYRCKQVKRAGLGRMAATLRKLGPTLSYLEQVRQHMSRLPSIDPNSRTLLVCGFPNVGKSSFLNKVSRADVEVQPYAFTTKSLYVGHTEYDYSTWQVIDTPGILDHSLENRNVIEMQSITALAHLDACILYFMDLSGECGYSVEAQVSLFQSIQPLFVGKPLVVVLNKSDLCNRESLSPADQELVQRMADFIGSQNMMIEISTLIDEAVGTLKESACKLLLQHRSQQSKNSQISASGELFCALPKGRDTIARPVSIPESVQHEIITGKVPPKVFTEKDIEERMGGPGVYFPSLEKHYLLEDEEWKCDVVPEILDGMNVFDYASPDIEQKLLEIELEQEQQVQKNANAVKKPSIKEDAQTKLALEVVQSQLAIRKMENMINKRRNVKKTKAMQVAIEKHQSGIGKSNVKVPSRKRTRGDMAEAALESERLLSISGGVKSVGFSKAGMTRTSAVTRGEGFRDMDQKIHAAKLMRLGARKWSNDGRKGEGDHSVPDMMPKHLYVGKMTVGKRRSR
ncbi:nucleolar GTP-binding protein [Perkinsela sp. CCAP 1560/4]|nr:nucleolar GTP-binding protein [Perkinsela sp. CCAP 1560/4]|eukprot:KNH09419.1 nucleolar GTP-binding protein [Perkinsela sp. CCAP 1560/4]